MSLRDVPIDAVGIPWEQWMEQQRERIFAEARAKRLAASGPSALRPSPMVPENPQLSPVAVLQAALPMLGEESFPLFAGRTATSGGSR